MKGYEVNVPSNTHIASWLSIFFVGATLVPVKLKQGTLNLAPTLLEAAISPIPALTFLYTFGHACRMTNVMEVAKRHNIYLIEDNV